MSKFTSISKKLIFVWGLISLAFVLFAAISLTISTIKGNRFVEQERNKIYEKNFGEIKLQVKKEIRKTSEQLLVTITKSGKPLIIDYCLPTDQYRLSPLDVNDSELIPVKGNMYRVILYSVVYECDAEAAHYIWCLKLTTDMSLVKVIELSDMHKIDGKEAIVFGNKIMGLPSFDNFKYEQFVVPIEITISDSIKATPMLNKKSADMIKSVFQKEAQKRIDILRERANNEMLEEYKGSVEKFDEAMAQKVIPY
jgi:hypothetical protein